MSFSIHINVPQTRDSNMKLQFSCAHSESFPLSFVHCFNVKIPPFDNTIVKDIRAASESYSINVRHLCCSMEQSPLKNIQSLFEKHTDLWEF